MPYPIIVLGAGASKDYSLYADSPAPLTNELLHPEFKNEASLTNYKEASDLLTQVAYPVRKGNKNFEEKLSEIKNQFGTQSHIKSQLIALGFYLRDVFRNVSSPTKVQQLNNYKTLLANIKNYCEGKACIVTFNYDTLFESAYRDKWSSMIDYINSDLKLIKLHGSYNWVYIQNKSLVHIRNEKTDYEFCVTNPDVFDELKVKGAEPYHIEEIDRLKDRQKYITFPAIAIPLPDKSGFICPRSHLNEFKKAFNEADRILIIGWKAGDKEFLDFMNSCLTRSIPCTVVSSSKKSAEDIIANKLYAISLNPCRSADGNFSDFVNGDGIKKFFAK